MDWIKGFKSVGPKMRLFRPVKRNPRTGEIRDARGRLHAIMGPHSWAAVKEIYENETKNRGNRFNDGRRVTNR